MIPFLGVTKTPTTCFDELTKKLELVVTTTYTRYDELDKVLVSTTAQKFELDYFTYGKCTTYPVLHAGVTKTPTICSDELDEVLVSTATKKLELVVNTTYTRYDELNDVLWSTVTKKLELVATTTYTRYDELDKVLVSTTAQKFELDYFIYGKCATYPVLHIGVSEILILLWHHFRCAHTDYYNGYYAKYT